MAHKKIKQKALATAKKSDVVRAKIGAILFTDAGQIVAFANNRTFYGDKTKWTIHAEESLIAKAHKLKAKKRFGHLNVLVVRLRRSKKSSALAKPCPRCQQLLDEAGFSVFYTDENGQVVPLKHRKTTD